MNLFGFLRRRPEPSASAAKERLQILLAHERVDCSSPDYLPLLQKEIIEVVRRHLQVDGDKVEVRLERGAELSTLEVNIELPGARALSSRRSGPRFIGGEAAQPG